MKKKYAKCDNDFTLFLNELVRIIKSKEITNKTFTFKKNYIGIAHFCVPLEDSYKHGEEKRDEDKYKKELANYIRVDEDEMSHIVKPFTYATVPKEQTYKNYLSVILDSFWTPHNKKNSNTTLEKQMEKLFCEMSIKALVIEEAQNILEESKIFKKLQMFVQDRLKVSLILIKREYET